MLIKSDFNETSSMGENHKRGFIFRKNKNKVNKSDISSPTNFRILQHIGISGRNKIDVCIWTLKTKNFKLLK